MTSHRQTGMNARLQEIIKYRINGRQNQFASLMGWAPQYLTKLLKGGGNFGLYPVLRIIEVLPEIDVCWLLTGKGGMFSENWHTRLRRHIVASTQRLLDLERLVPVMTPDELRKFESYLANLDGMAFNNDEIAAMKMRIEQKERGGKDNPAESQANQNKYADGG